MVTKYKVDREGDSGRDRMPLDIARRVFGWLVTGPAPVVVDGRLFPGLPDRPVPLNEVRDRLLRPRCSQVTRDAVWAHLVLRSRTQGATWTVGCVGVALPALIRTAARLSARFAGDVSDVHAAVLTGFVAELSHVDLGKPRIMLRLRWAAYRAGHTAVREALDAPVPSGTGFRSSEPAPPSGHPDFVLARAVAHGVLSAGEAELIGSTRLEGLPLATAAEERGGSYQATKKTRRRAEHRLATYLRDDAATEPGLGGGDLARQVVDAVTISTAAQAATTPLTPSLSVTKPARRARKKSRARLSPRRPETGVQGCGRTSAAPVPTGAVSVPSPQTPEVPRCA